MEVLKVKMLVEFANGFQGAFEVDGEYISFIPAEEDGEWHSLIRGFLVDSDQTIVDTFNAEFHMSLHVCADEFIPLIRKLEKLIEAS